MNNVKIKVLRTYQYRNLEENKEQYMYGYNPPFTITNSILSHVTSISEKVGRITVMSNMENKHHLRKNNRIKSIHSSLKIEANSLSLSQVRNVINGKLVLGEAKEIQEVKNAYNAYEKIAEIDPYSIEEISWYIDNILDELLNQMTNSATDDTIIDANGANHDADNMEGRLLSGLEQNPCITQTDLAEELSLSRRTVQRMMKKLMDDGKIKRIGSTRTGYWEIKEK